jgi:hypothetical protein
VASLVWACRQGSSLVSSSLPGAPNARDTCTHHRQRLVPGGEGQ